MHFLFLRRTAGQIEYGIIFGMIAVLALLAARFLPLLDVLPQCTFRGLTGFPCATCGSTRAVVFLSQGYVFPALTINPLVSLVFLSAVFVLLYSTVTLVFDLPRVNIVCTEREKDRLRWAVVVVALLNWIYLIFVL